VLIVDDFRDFRRFVCSILQQRVDYQVVGEAFDGLEALQKAQELRPDLILLDVGLPRLNGIAVAANLRKLAVPSKILFLSQEFSPEVVHEALGTGAQGYVQKVRAARDLLPAMEAVLRGERFVSERLKADVDTGGRHEVQFYSSDSIFVEAFAHFIAPALEVGNPAIVVVTTSHQNGLFQRLKMEGFNIERAIQQGTYISVNPGDILTTIDTVAPNLVQFFEGFCGLIDSASKAAKNEHPRIALCAECVGLLCAEGHTNAAIQLETVGNRLIRTHNVDILCAYPLSSLRDQDGAFRRICAEHTAVHFR